MLKPTQIAETASTNQLIKLWAARYSPDLSILVSKTNLLPVAEIISSASQAGRSKTVAEVKRSLRFNCELAVFRTHALFTSSADNLAEARQCAQYLERAYEQILEVYRQQTPLNNYLKFIDSSSDLFGRLAKLTLRLPAIHQLADKLEFVLVQLQQQLLASKEPRMVSFMTTQFHLGNRKILESLSACEQMLLQPFLKFVEEQVCMQWQRICAAAANYSTHSPTLGLVKQLFGASDEIASIVYHQTVPLFSSHRSRRGVLVDPAVAASTLRDFNMIQSYLWLCVLEEKTDPITQELVPLWKAVLPSIHVRWDLGKYMLQLLVDEIHSRLDVQQQELLTPYTRSIVELFHVPAEVY